MTTAILMRGLPLSGKSTIAKRLFHRIPSSAIVAKDDLREMLYPDRKYHDTDLWAIQSIRDDIVKRLIKYRTETIILDETFIEIMDIGNALTLFEKDDIIIVVDLTSVSLETCLGRNELRTRKLFFSDLWDADRRLKIHQQHFPHLLGRHVEVVTFDNMDKLMEDIDEIQARFDRNEGIPFSQGA